MYSVAGANGTAVGEYASQLLKADVNFPLFRRSHFPLVMIYMSTLPVILSVSEESV